MYRVPEVLRTPPQGSQKAVRARREYVHPWWENPAAPLSSDCTHVLTEHGWCRVGAVKKTPSTPSRLYAQCDCSKGHMYPLRTRAPGDGNPDQS